jgi:hypothetical protein
VCYNTETMGTVFNFMQNLDLISSERFHHDIEQLVQTKKLDYSSAILHYCELKQIDIESINDLVDSQLRFKLQNYYESVRLLKKSGTRKLPI